MRVYVDTSALLKRVVAEAESDALEATLQRHVEAGDALVSSALAWIEVSRALRRRLESDGAESQESPETVTQVSEDALSGIAERSITADVVSLARRVGPTPLRSLDAIHLATAILIDADVLLGYDERLVAAAQASGLTVRRPTPAR